MAMNLQHPADQIVQIMDRIYQNRMTTVSGGNLSILDGNGDIWITPSGIDKGALTRNDICRVTPGGEMFGPHKPSIELPFHSNVYKRRPGLRAVLHAHPPALVAFSAARVLPDIRLADSVYQTLGSITMAHYALPGSQTLGDSISAEFEKGFDTVVLENHGVVAGGSDLFKAYMKFETLESAANLEIYARKLGIPKALTGDEIKLSDAHGHLPAEEFIPDKPGSEERAARRDMTAMVRRSYRQKLFTGTQGTYSVRLSGGGFLITPGAVDRAYMAEDDLVLIKNGMREQGKFPSRWAALHQKIYEICPAVHSIAASAPPYAMAFAVTGTALDPRTIPESYIMLRDVQSVPFSAAYLKPDETAAMFTGKTPTALIENSQVIATGCSLINAFDRLEVMEATARSIIAAKEIGPVVHISGSEVADIDAAFNLK